MPVSKRHENEPMEGNISALAANRFHSKAPSWACEYVVWAGGKRGKRRWEKPQTTWEVLTIPKYAQISQERGQHMPTKHLPQYLCPDTAGSSQKISFQAPAWHLAEIWSSGWTLTWAGNSRTLNFVCASLKKNIWHMLRKKNRDPLILYSH